MPPCSVWSPPFSPLGSSASLVLLTGITPNCFRADLSDISGTPRKLESPGITEFRPVTFQVFYLYRGDNSRRWKDKYGTPETRHTLLFKKTSRTMLFHVKSHIWRFLLHLFFSLQPFNLSRIWSNVSAVLCLCGVRHGPGSTVKVMDLVWIGLGVKTKSSLSFSLSLLTYYLQNMIKWKKSHCKKLSFF